MYEHEIFLNWLHYIIPLPYPPKSKQYPLNSAYRYKESGSGQPGVTAAFVLLPSCFYFETNNVAQAGLKLKMEAESTLPPKCQRHTKNVSQPHRFLKVEMGVMRMQCALYGLWSLRRWKASSLQCVLGL